MAGSLSLIGSSLVEKPASAFKNRWQISFSRFIVVPSPPPSSSSLLVPVPTRRRRPFPRGTWISSDSPTAILQLSNYRSISHAILSVSFEDYILEEHHVTKLHFSWPQVSCLSGYPPRGTRSVFVSYRDSLGVFQKFACRFRSVSEAETFINDLKDLMKDHDQTTPLNTEFQSEISSQSVSLSSDRSSSRVHAESTVMSPITRISDEIPLNVSYEVEGDSPTNITASTHHSESEFTALPSNYTSKMTDFDEMILDNVVEVVSCNAETAVQYNEGASAALPPSFTSLLANCYHPEVNEATAQPSLSDNNDLKSEIARLMDDSSFQEMLLKVEKVISEIGDDLML